MATKHLLLLSGKAQAGKDTFAASIASLGFERYAFADALKHEALSGGWDGIKDFRGRLLLQELGSVWRKYEPDHWILRLQESIMHDRAVITDCRYLNEISLMQSWGHEYGYKVITIRINRPGHDNGLSPEAQAHPSECELDGYPFDVCVTNKGALLDFCRQSLEKAREILSGEWTV